MQVNPMTLAEARRLLHQDLANGIDRHCSCCGQHVKLYKRGINSTMARGLITMYRHAGKEFTHTPSLPGDTHEMSQFAWWGLIEDQGVLREDGGRAGWWRITDKGEAFVKNQIEVPKKAHIFDATILGWSEERTTIIEALRFAFDYRELMSA